MTKLHVKKMEMIRHKMGYLHSIDVGVDGLIGGHSLGWKPRINATCLSYSKNHIDVEVIKSYGSMLSHLAYIGKPTLPCSQGF